jgi:DNA repair ATPase RecN
MSEIENTRAKVEALSGQVDQMQTRVLEDVEALKAKLAQRDIDEAVLEEINSGLDRISQRVQTIDPDPSNPPTETPEVDPTRAA